LYETQLQPDDAAVASRDVDATAASFTFVEAPLFEAVPSEPLGRVASFCSPENFAENFGLLRQHATASAYSTLIPVAPTLAPGKVGIA